MRILPRHPVARHRPRGSRRYGSGKNRKNQNKHNNHHHKNPRQTPNNRCRRTLCLSLAALGAAASCCLYYLHTALAVLAVDRAGLFGPGATESQSQPKPKPSTPPKPKAETAPGPERNPPEPFESHDHNGGGCAINLFGLPRSFKHHVLPSLAKNVVRINRGYGCDYFVHFFDLSSEEGEAQRGGNRGGALSPEDVYRLKDVVEAAWKEAKRAREPPQRMPIVRFVSDTNEDFEATRKDAINEIVHGRPGGSPTNNYSASDSASNNNSNNNNNKNKIKNNNQKNNNNSIEPGRNPYFVHEPSFTNQTLVNILKMWHSQDRVWNLMEEESSSRGGGKPFYGRVAMLRLDVVYTTPIDIYNIPLDPIPEDYNEDYMVGLKFPVKYQRKHKGKTIEHASAWKDPRFGHHCVLPGFKSFPVNDRYFSGPYSATEVWARDRFSRARNHVFSVLPALERERQEALARDPGRHLAAGGDHLSESRPLTDYGLHDERFVAHTILPAIRGLASGESDAGPMAIQVDRGLYFCRVRADGSIWLRDKPGFGRVEKSILESALGRKCTGEPFEVDDGVLGEKSPGRWQILCPP